MISRLSPTLALSVRPLLPPANFMTTSPVILRVKEDSKSKMFVGTLVDTTIPAPIPFTVPTDLKDAILGTWFFLAEMTVMFLVAP